MSPRSVSNRSFLQLVHALFFAMVAWLLHTQAGPLAEVPVLGWPVMLLNFPVATFWLFFPTGFRIDYWYGNYFEYAHPGAFYSHMFGATLVYWLFLRFAWPKVRGLLPDWFHRKAFPALHVYSAGANRWAIATLVVGAIWYIHLNEFQNYWYFLVRDVARLANFPVALVSLLMPAELRGLHIWFFDPDMSGIEMSRTTLGIHLVLGIPTYYLILTGYSWLRRRRDRIEGQPEAPQAG